MSWLGRLVQDNQVVVQLDCRMGRWYWIEHWTVFDLYSTRLGWLGKWSRCVKDMVYLCGFERWRRLRRWILLNTATGTATCLWWGRDWSWYWCIGCLPVLIDTAKGTAQLWYAKYSCLSYKSSLCFRLLHSTIVLSILEEFVNESLA